MAYYPSSNISVIPLGERERMGGVFYRKKAMEGGYLKDVVFVKSPNSHEIQIGARITATGEFIRRTVDADPLLAIDNDVCRVIDEMVSEAKEKTA